MEADTPGDWKTGTYHADSVYLQRRARGGTVCSRCYLEMTLFAVGEYRCIAIGNHGNQTRL